MLIKKHVRPVKILAKIVSRLWRKTQLRTRGMFFDLCHCSLVIYFEQSWIRVKFLEDSADTVRIQYTVDRRHYTPIRVFGSSSCTI
jgi:hypothetical protein